MLVTSVNIENQSFIVINNPDIDALQIFAYNSTYDNFYDYQNVYFESKVTGLNAVYIGGRSFKSKDFCEKDCRHFFILCYVEINFQSTKKAKDSL